MDKVLALSDAFIRLIDLLSACRKGELKDAICQTLLSIARERVFILCRQIFKQREKSSLLYRRWKERSRGRNILATTCARSLEASLGEAFIRDIMGLLDQLGSKLEFRYCEETRLEDNWNRITDEEVQAWYYKLTHNICLFCDDKGLREGGPCYKKGRGLLQDMVQELGLIDNEKFDYILIVCSDIPLDHGVRSEVDKKLKEYLNENQYGCRYGIACTCSKLKCNLKCDIIVPEICIALCKSW